MLARLWNIDARRLSAPARLGVLGARILVHTAGQFARHQVGIRAAGLTLVTLLALVPLLMVGSAIAGAFGFRQDLEDALRARAADLPAEYQAAVEQIVALVDRTSFQTLGFVGVGMLLYAGLTLFSGVEQAMNFAWRVPARRALLRRLTNFVALVAVVPVLMLVALSITSILRDAPWSAWLAGEWPWVAPLYDAGLWIVPHAMAWAALSGLYLLMPSSGVRVVPGVASGLLAGSALIGVHTAYIELQVGAARANAIYATLAAVPLLIAYLQTGWTVVLMGAEFGYAVQNAATLGPGRDPSDLSAAVRERVALHLVERACLAHDEGREPIRLAEEAQALDLPPSWLGHVAAELERASLLVVDPDGRGVPA
ncbi:MAG: YihY/virulence factor BrkB family protein, partial [Planctomycetota bacterium]|nr:YihY/virulence factor BrkB family protein [Planctomycetota bacterium]